ncbi:TonB-dependent receptor plug domain-containing protein [Neisseria perflava]|uniref:TonB-dependent receptor plug domain-containing protein n=1 Tax=Neisseria perflava TaxID=33053 RepID=UPI00209D73C6|nr:TonB-dependent receptor plug domain-containing protein [Neisseria perflava]MCP1661315.1 hypothetical protein [Neisseria perflava]
MKPTVMILALASAFSTPYAFADETATAENAENNVEYSTDLGELVVRGETYANKMGTQRISEEKIERRPSTNGNLTELLKNNANVQFSNTAESSTSGGEIKPDEVSFHGEKYYNNNFTIDGISNNDNLNPGSGGYYSATTVEGLNPWDLPAGGTQSFWIDSGLVKNLEVFDSNVAAKYGNFTGGVVNAQLKDPSTTKASGKIYIRTTRDSWAKQHIAPGDEEDFENTANLYQQPQFTKKEYGVVINQPINDQTGILFSYGKKTSNIPFTHGTLRNADEATAVVGENTYRSSQYRSNETWLLRGLHRTDSGDTWKATAMYSPHESRYLVRNVADSNFANKGGGVRFDLEWDKAFDWGNMTSQIAYRKTGNEIKYDADVYRLYRRTASIPYRSSSTTVGSGGYGEWETEKSTFTLKQDYNFDSFFTGAIKHHVGFGWQTDFSEAKYDRASAANLYTYTASSSVTCGDAEECIDGEQYASRWTTYAARNVKVKDNVYSLYVQDNMSWKNLSVNAGLRFDRNSFLGNNNIAPRLAVAYDLFGDTRSRVFGGLNRYYGSSILAYKLRQAIGSNETCTRTLSNGTPGAWGSCTSGTGGSVSYDVSGLKTPYSDEAVLGFTQKMFNTVWTAKWVHRNGKDQFTRRNRSETDTTRIMTNDGWSKNNTFTLSVAPEKAHEFKYATIDWNFGVSVQKTKTNNSYYDSSSYNDTDKAIYQNQLMNAEELPPTDFNVPWRTFLSLNTYFPKIRLNWDQRFSWNGARKYLYASSTIDCSSSTTYASACGSYTGEATLYRDAELKRAFIVDWRFAYSKKMPFGHSLELTLDVNNVFDKVTFSTTSSGTTYKMGRNYWFGASYKW